MKQEIELCNVCETGKVIAHYEGHAFCSCQCFLVWSARKWPELVKEINSREQFVKSRQKAIKFKEAAK